MGKDKSGTFHVAVALRIGDKTCVCCVFELREGSMPCIKHLSPVFRLPISQISIVKGRQGRIARSHIPCRRPCMLCRVCHHYMVTNHIYLISCTGTSVRVASLCLLIWTNIWRGPVIRPATALSRSRWLCVEPTAFASVLGGIRFNPSEARLPHWALALQQRDPRADRPRDLRFADKRSVAPAGGWSSAAVCRLPSAVGKLSPSSTPR